MLFVRFVHMRVKGLSPYGERELKLFSFTIVCFAACLSPYGERELKW